jgi:hypothetical protein
MAIPLFMFMTMSLIVPRVEIYSQRAAIDFFTSVSREDAYLETVGYKSYAQLYYGKVQKHANANAWDEKWLLNGAIDKPAYFVVKINKKEKFMEAYPHIEWLYDKNGFVFFKRSIHNSHD